jgi:TetR/AcrR family transcriptional regulator
MVSTRTSPTAKATPETPGTPTAARMPAAQRRDLILTAATELFAQRGYHGTTTDQVARAAGISQPYVVRLFGTKEQLFLEVLGRALETLFVAFRGALPDPGDGSRPEQRLGEAFIDLVRSVGLHRTLLHAFVSGNDPVIGAAARKGFVSIYTFLRDEAHFVPEQIQQFLGYGMLMSVLLGIELPSTFGDKCSIVLAVAGPDAA